MPTLPVAINRGVYKNVDRTSIVTSEYATELLNFLIDDSGANIDRPALSRFATVGSFPIHGMSYFKPEDVVVAVTGDRRIITITEDGVVSNITGSLLAGTSRPIFATDGTYLAIAGGGAPQQWDGTGTTASLAGSPPSTKWIAYLDGYWILILNNDQEARIAGPTAVLRQTFDSSDFFQQEGLPDITESFLVLNREAYFFGQESIEIFQNYGEGSNPFRRSFFVEDGTLSPYSIGRDDNTVWWLNKDRRIMRMEGRTPKQISTPYDRVIQKMSDVSDVWFSAIKKDGFYLLAWTFPTEQKCFVYNQTKDDWYEWDSFANGESDRMKMHCHVNIPEWNKSLVGDPVTGLVYEMTFDAHMDGTRNVRRMRRMRYNHGTKKKKRSDYFLIDVKKGVGTPGETEPVFTVRVNDDNTGWTDPKTYGLGFPGADSKPIKAFHRGIYHTREVEILCTDNCEFRLNGIDEEATPLG